MKTELQAHQLSTGRRRVRRRAETATKENIMKYMLLICTDSSVVLTDEQKAGLPEATGKWVQETDGAGIRLDGSALRPVSDATTVRVRRDEVLLADGPFAETKEQIAGFDIIECADLDQAIEVASKHPVASFGTIEVRPFWQ
ncbi:MAG TPA: YciI family protein [Streptosporangiaceae bacterium]